MEIMATKMDAIMAVSYTHLIDCAINADEMVHPMVNGGHHITEFLLS